ncbi:hypothetical protein [Thermococcus sp.]|uniref:EGFR-like transmembrane domain-containing protein n=1 Tax=Thermococcus sp. TaxID=35749 RepID=UPI0025CEC461|nr:hypothetical protein [Thermococcus sp.]
MNRTFEAVFISLIFLLSVVPAQASNETCNNVDLKHGPLEDYVYRIEYSVISSGSDAFVYLQLFQYAPVCKAGFCYDFDMTPIGGSLLYFNGSRRYSLDFTKATNSTFVDYNGVVFVNRSWYLNITAYPQDSSEGIEKVYKFNQRNFCVEPVGRNWSQLSKNGTSTAVINGWQIETPMNDICVTMSKNAWCWAHECCPSVILANSSVFPVYFTLRRGNHTRNVTVIYLNMNTTLEDFFNRLPPNTAVPIFWFPKSVKIVNVTVCKSTAPRENTTLNETKTQTSAQGSTTRSSTNTIEKTNKTSPSPQTSSKKSICGPGLIVIIVVGTMFFVRKRRS